MMSDQNVANNWRLEETGETQDRWKLQEAEQGLAAQWQLQDEPRTEASWQPVDYTRERPGPGNWVLPALVVIALIAVVGYIAWIGLTRFNLLTPVSTTDVSQTPVSIATSAADANTPDATALAANIAVTQTTAPTVAPTEPPAATAIIVPTPAPTPTVARVEQEFISVSDPAGVNARSEPNATSAVVKLLEPGQRVLAVTEEQDWIQVALARNSLAWVKAEFVDRSSQLVSLEEANQRRVELGLPPLASSPAPGAATEPLTGTTTSTLTAGVTNTAGITNVTSTTSPTTTGILVSTPLTATINITTGLNARTVPTTTGTPIKLLNNGARYKVTGRSADNQWLQITLEDGASAWVFAEYVNVNGNTNTLPVPSNSATLTTTRAITTSAIAILTTTTPVSGTNGAVGEATLTVSSLSGANARPTPDRTAESLTLFPFEAALPVVGRSADNQWLQVRLNDGKLGWMLMSAVKLSVDIATLPVVNP
ncbi:hypothetical protein BH10CHL1_BH10CHL1_24060 [soil metagenome]